MKIDTKPFHDLRTELKLGLNGIYGSRLKGLYLYGSYARREQLNGNTLFLSNVREKALPL